MPFVLPSPCSEPPAVLRTSPESQGALLRPGMLFIPPGQSPGPRGLCKSHFGAQFLQSGAAARAQKDGEGEPELGGIKLGLSTAAALWAAAWFPIAGITWV